MNQYLNHIEFYDPQSGRTWTVDTVDKFIVGHIHGGFTFDQVLLYITHNNPSLAGITAVELEIFWHRFLMDHTKPLIANWANLRCSDPRVQAVLNRIAVLHFCSHICPICNRLRGWLWKGGTWLLNSNREKKRKEKIKTFLLFKSQSFTSPIPFLFSFLSSKFQIIKKPDSLISPTTKIFFSFTEELPPPPAFSKFPIVLWLMFYPDIFRRIFGIAEMSELFGCFAVVNISRLNRRSRFFLACQRLIYRLSNSILPVSAVISYAKEFEYQLDRRYTKKMLQSRWYKQLTGITHPRPPTNIYSCEQKLPERASSRAGSGRYNKALFFPLYLVSHYRSYRSTPTYQQCSFIVA